METLWNASKEMFYALIIAFFLYLDDSSPHIKFKILILPQSSKGDRAFWSPEKLFLMADTPKNSWQRPCIGILCNLKVRIHTGVHAGSSACSWVWLSLFWSSLLAGTHLSVKAALGRTWHNGLRTPWQVFQTI